MICQPSFFLSLTFAAAVADVQNDNDDEIVALALTRTELSARVSFYLSAPLPQKDSRWCTADEPTVLQNTFDSIFEKIRQCSLCVCAGVCEGTRALRSRSKYFMKEADKWVRTAVISLDTCKDQSVGEGKSERELMKEDRLMEERKKLVFKLIKCFDSWI